MISTSGFDAFKRTRGFINHTVVSTENKKFKEQIIQQKK
jgi:hypothetical protein